MRQINAEAVIEAVKADLEAEDRIDLLEWLVDKEEWNVVSFLSYVNELIEQVERAHPSLQDNLSLSFQGFLAQLPDREGDQGTAAASWLERKQYYGREGQFFRERDVIEKAKRWGIPLRITFKLQGRSLTRAQWNRMDGDQQEEWEQKQMQKGFAPGVVLPINRYGGDGSVPLSRLGIDYALYLRIPVAEISYDNNYLDFDKVEKLKARAEQDYPHIFAAVRS